MTRVLVPLAQGCEELEAITIIDLLVRAGVEVVAAGLDESTVIASRGTKILPDTSLDKLDNKDFDMIVLPGGLPGADHLRDNTLLQGLLKNQAANNKYVAAICAAPKALASAGLLEGKTATGYPGVLSSLNLKNTVITDSAIEIDGKVVTSRGPGTAMDFALTLIELLVSAEKKQEVEKGLAR